MARRWRSSSEIILRTRLFRREGLGESRRVGLWRLGYLVDRGGSAREVGRRKVMAGRRSHVS